MVDFFSSLITNILGVLIGGLIAYRIARWQFDTQVVNEAKKNQVLLRENIERIRKELNKNLGILKELSGVLEKSKSSRVDIIEWGLTYVEAFSFFSFKHDIYDSYNELENILNWYKQSAKAHNFYLGFGGSQEEANKEFELIKMNVNQIMNKLENNLKRFDEFSPINI